MSEHGGIMDGIKTAHATAGFWGAALSLVVSDRMPAVKMASFITTGVVSSYYVTPTVAELVRVWMPITERAENGIAFLIGFTAMLVLGGVLKFARQFMADPIGTIKGALKHD